MTRKHILPLAALAMLVIAAAAATLYLALPSNSTPRQLWAVDSTPLHTEAAGTFAGGRLAVAVSTPRSYGYRIGTPIYVEVLVAARPGVKVSFETLEAMVLTRQGGSYELAAPPVISESTKGKVTVWKLAMTVRFWVPNPEPFKAEFLYSDKDLAAGQPDWQYLQTPPVAFGYSNTAPPGAQNIQHGPTGDLPYGFPLRGWLLIALAILLGSVTPGILIRMWWRRRHAPRVPTEAERFWLTVDAIAGETIYSGWQGQHYKQVAAAFRKYLHAEPQTAEEMTWRLIGHPQLQAILLAEDTLDQTLYAQRLLSEDEHRQLLAELEQVIPRPARKPNPVGRGMPRPC